MTLREMILNGNKKDNATAVCDWVGDDARRFAQLVGLFLHDEYRVVQKAAWIISLVSERQPQLIDAHLEAIVQRMQEPGLPVAVRRNAVRIMQFIDLPESLHGPVMNACFDFVADPREAIAVRAFSMTILANLAKAYPEIGQELAVLLEEALEQESSPGLRNRAQKVLKAIRSLS